MLNRIEAGNDGAFQALLIVHGLFGSARNWGAIQKRMASDRRVLAVDQRNHGESFRAETQSYHDMAADLAEVIESEGFPMDVVGHSMGGKAAMVLALTRPDLVNRLVVADIAPVAYGHSNRHLVHAMRDLDVNGLSARSEADRRLQTSVTDPGTRAFLLQSLDLKAEPPRWRLNLSVLDVEMDKITGWPEEVDGVYEGPVLFLSGALSDYVTADYRERIKGYFPKAVMAKIPGAGHWLHAEKPREFEAALRTFLS
ncbi:alpha/beta fold hydrolase [Frigidibacter sp. SD6-1]|uniref:alpha/beta fold hydrolase n=1 Tax=Frigidibacter sp. SD6-1 TaxID=3032581 RepID=UPI0024DF678F|nr:alpha/beta fold hydrolase [Frigidibacter sp. SD6-1]